MKFNANFKKCFTLIEAIARYPVIGCSHVWAKFGNGEILNQASDHTRNSCTSGFSGDELTASRH